MRYVQPRNDSRVEVSIPFNSYTVDAKGNAKLAVLGMEGKFRFVISACNEQQLACLAFPSGTGKGQREGLN